MREIKFRAWDKKSKKIREVNFIAFHNKRDAFSFNPSNTPKIIHLWGRDMIEDKDILLNREEKQVELMQFTGLKDKNGVEIYEGDIISFVTEKTCYDGLPLNTNRIGKVFWMEFRSVFAVQINKFMNQDLFVYVQNDNSVEVIGNVYENPELLSTPTAVL